MDELAHDLRPFGIAEVQIIGRGERQRAGRSQVSPALGDRLLAALERIGFDIARRNVRRKGKCLRLMALDADHAGVAARQLQRIALDQRVILLIDPAARRIVGGADELQKRIGNISLRDVVGGERRGCPCRRPGAVVFRRLVAELLDRQVRHFFALVQDAETQIVVGLAHDREIEAHLTKIALASSSFSGRSTISMRSWLSESIIS